MDARQLEHEPRVNGTEHERACQYVQDLHTQMKLRPLPSRLAFPSSLQMCPLLLIYIYCLLSFAFIVLQKPVSVIADSDFVSAVCKCFRSLNMPCYLTIQKDHWETRELDFLCILVRINPSLHSVLSMDIEWLIRRISCFRWAATIWRITTLHFSFLEHTFPVDNAHEFLVR